MWRSTPATRVGFALVVMLAAPQAAAQGLPQHIVTYMAAAGQTQCPDDWTEAAYAQGRLVLGTTDGAEVQVMAGTPAQDATPPGHDHDFTVTGTVASVDSMLYPTDTIPRAGGGEAKSSGTVDAAAADLPFIQFLVCEQTATQSVDTAPYGTVAFFNAQACPENWAPLDQADGRFVVAAFSSSVPPGYATSTSWDPTSPPSHTHGLKSSFETHSQVFELYVENQGNLASQGTYALQGETAGGGPVLPFVTLLVCEKDSLGNNQGIPLGTMIFFGAEECPDDWGITIGANGRFVIGIGGNGTQGATFGSGPLIPDQTSTRHQHGYSGEVSPPASSYPGASPRPDYEQGSFVTTDGSGYSGTSDASTSDVPYVVLQACTYTAGQAQR